MVADMAVDMAVDMVADMAVDKDAYPCETLLSHVRFSENHLNLYYDFRTQFVVGV